MALDSFPASKTYNNCVVIPAYNEPEDFLLRFIHSNLANNRALLILVINQPDCEKESSLQINLEQQCKKMGRPLWQNDNVSLIAIDNKQTEILLIERFRDSNTIPAEQGVGLARKIGADIATVLIDQGFIKSPWICSSDADAYLPDNYFSALTAIIDNTAAITYNFSHINNGDVLSNATLRYEQALQYYVSGLKWAGSDYAFHTIGSTIAFRYDHYSSVRGFPKRAAGEDFYLLNKLAKLAPVRKLENATIQIESRLSDRVPFGTGPAVCKILQLPEIENYLYYHPQLFIELKNCLTAMKLLWRERNAIEAWFSTLSVPAQAALQKLQIHKLTIHIQKQISDEQQCNRHIREWFDGFRTLKFIHYMQDANYPPIPLEQALEKAPFRYFD